MKWREIIFLRVAPPTQRAISTSSKLLAGALPASKDRF
jgi:hypothetical protein